MLCVGRNHVSHTHAPIPSEVMLEEEEEIQAIK